MIDDYDLTVVQVAEGQWGVQIGETVIRTHGPTQCEGFPCPFHNPSEHHMRSWPINVRLDRSALCERKCLHGIGHPDPDSVHYFERIGRYGTDIHGCDGCC